MKKVIYLFVALGIYSCSKNCECGTIVSKTDIGDNMSSIQVEYYNCEQNTDSFILDSIQTNQYQINDEYCF